MKMAYTQSHSPDDYLKLLAQLVAQYKQRTYELMEVAPGSQVLDVGCGPGTDTTSPAAAKTVLYRYGA